MLNQEIYDELVAKFEKMYGKKPEIVAYAPGRIEVLGNHTDYNEGYVFSAAIDKGTFFAVSPTADDSCELTAGDFMETAKFTTSTVAPAKEMTWQNYVTGTFNWLFDGNPAAAKHGWKGMFLGNIPLGAGLSSSAALEMCTVLALSKLYGIEKDKTTLAKIGQKAEHTFAGCPCGLLDQASSMYGKAGALVKSDFRTNEFESVPMGDGVAFMMVKSNAKHALVDGAYASRRQACEDAAKYFAGVLRKKVTHLRDVTMAEWVLYRGGLSETTAKRAVHPIGEDERVLQGAALLEKGDLKGFGALMYDQLVREFLRAARRDRRRGEGDPRGLRRPSFGRRFRRQLLPPRRSFRGRQDRGADFEGIQGKVRRRADLQRDQALRGRTSRLKGEI